jgi:hypothetical protein
MQVWLAYVALGRESGHHRRSDAVAPRVGRGQRAPAARHHGEGGRRLGAGRAGRVDDEEGMAAVRRGGCQPARCCVGELERRAPLCLGGRAEEELRKGRERRGE